MWVGYFSLERNEKHISSQAATTRWFVVMNINYGKKMKSDCPEDEILLSFHYNEYGWLGQ